MLPAAARMRRRADFTAAVRRGVRAGHPLLVVHLVTDAGTTGSTVGFVVSRAVGNSVVRNRVRRRLRHVVRGRLTALPEASRLVVRANAASASADSGELEAAFDSALTGALGRVRHPGGRA